MTATMPARPESRSENLEKARNGDREAFDLLVRECRSSLERHVRTRIGDYLRNRIDFEDVLQDTCARAWKSIGGFRGLDSGAFLRWLKGIAEHVILDGIGSRRRDQVIYVEEAVDPIHPGPSPSRAQRRAERFIRLREALESLAPEHREVVLLVRIKGLKIREAAERMNRTPNAVTKLLSRALNKLKEAFGDTESLHLPPESLEGPGGKSHGE